MSANPRALNRDRRRRRSCGAQADLPGPPEAGGACAVGLPQEVLLSSDDERPLGAATTPRHRRRSCQSAPGSGWRAGWLASLKRASRIVGSDRVGAQVAARVRSGPRWRGDELRPGGASWLSALRLSGRAAIGHWRVPNLPGLVQRCAFGLPFDPASLTLRACRHL